MAEISLASLKSAPMRVRPCQRATNVVVVARGYVTLVSRTYAELVRRGTLRSDAVSEPEFVLYHVLVWWQRINRRREYDRPYGPQSCTSPIFFYLSMMTEYESALGTTIRPAQPIMDDSTGALPSFNGADGHPRPEWTCHPYPAVAYGNLHDIVFGNPHGTYLQSVVADLPASEDVRRRAILGYGEGFGQQKDAMFDGRCAILRELITKFKESLGVTELLLGVPLVLVTKMAVALQCATYNQCTRLYSYTCPGFQICAAAVLTTPRHAMEETKSVEDSNSPMFYVTSLIPCDAHTEVSAAMFGMREIIRPHPDSFIHPSIGEYITPPGSQAQLFNTVIYKGNPLFVDYLIDDVVAGKVEVCQKEV